MRPDKDTLVHSRVMYQGGSMVMTSRVLMDIDMLIKTRPREQASESCDKRLGGGAGRGARVVLLLVVAPMAAVVLQQFVGVARSPGPGRVVGEVARRQGL